MARPAIANTGLQGRVYEFCSQSYRLNSALSWLLKIIGRRCSGGCHLTLGEGARLSRGCTRRINHGVGASNKACQRDKPLLSGRIARGWLPQVQASVIVGFMPVRRSADKTPDLFSAPPPAKASDSPAVPTPAADQQASEPRYLLPKDLAGSLKRLDDGEIDMLLSAVTTEAERRGRLPKPQANAKPTGLRRAVEEVAGGLTKGKLNAVHAAFKAGVKPSAIARQFGISQSDVRKALSQGLDRGP